MLAQRLRKGLRRTGLITVYILSIILIWEAVVKFTGIPIWLIPAPSDIMLSIVQRYNLYLENMYVTFYETMYGFLLGSVVGVALAISFAYSNFIRSILNPIVIAINSIPKIAIGPLIVIWFGIGVYSKIAMSFIMSFFPVVINVLMGLEQINPNFIELSRSLQASTLQTFTKIRLPHSIPFLMGALKISLPLAIIGAVLGEFLAGREGLGYLILLAMNYLASADLFALLLLITIMSLALFKLIDIISKRVMKWKPEKS